jgi:hypothetical protein
MAPRFLTRDAPGPSWSNWILSGVTNAKVNMIAAGK